MSLMIEKFPRSSATDISLDALSHSRDLLLALSRAAQTIQRARTAQDFYNAVGNEIKSFGGEVTLLMINEDHQSFTAAYTSYLPSQLRRVEKLVGTSVIGYRIVFPPDSIYARKFVEGNAEYVHWTKEHIAESLPADIRPLANQVVNFLKIKEGILAPLRVDNETLGLMMVSGLSLIEEDVPAMDSFAGHIAAGLYNIRLMQKIQDELAARKQAEEALNHNRDLLLALSRAAQAIQLVREPEEIYQVVGEQIKALGFNATILMFGSDHKSLYYRYTTISETIIHTIEKMAGLSALEYSWPISLDGSYDRIIMNGKAEYIPWAGDLFADALPKFLRPLTTKLMQLLGVKQGIIAPLHIGEEDFGL
jgi:hypothetical protein